MRPAAPGSRIGSGRLRVDAARAIAKLREYQLAERTTWICEAVRAAVASGATEVELDGDSNDVWLSWSGPPWDPEVLPRLLDELVSPEPSRDAQHLRLLATAINSALGLDPAYVDLCTVGEDGSARAVRYTPEVLELPDDEDDEPAIRRLACESVDPPRRAPACGMHLHLRRRAGLETFGHFIRGAVAPELAIAEQSCRDLEIPIRIGKSPHGRDRFTGDLLRADLGGSLRGFLAVQEPEWATHEEPVAEIAERGVVITRYGLGTDFGPGRAPIPIRLFVDAPRMPTNASRSDVRRDAHPVKQAELRARELSRPLIEQLAAELDGGEPVRRARLRDAALALLASRALGADWPHRLRAIRGPLEILAHMELVKNAVGDPRPVASVWTPGVVHHGRAPLDRELAPWVDDVLWVPPGDPAARLIEKASVDPAGLKKRIKTARKQLKRRRRFYRARERTPQVETRRGDWIHAAVGAPLPGSAIDDAVFAEVTGELALSKGDGLAEVTLLLDGRPIETVELISPVRFSAIVAHPELRPLPSYRGVHKNTAYNRAVNAATGAAVRAIEAVAMAEGGELPPEGYRLGRRRPTDADRVARLMRGGLALARKLAGGSVDGPMIGIKAWPSGDSEWLSTAELRGLPVIGTAPFGTRLSLDRVVVNASPADRDLLGDLLGDDTAIVHYDPGALPQTGDLAEKLARDLAIGPLAALAIREPTRRGAIAWGVRRSRLEVLHAGAPVCKLTLEPELAPCVIAVDDDELVPDATWSGVADQQTLGHVASSFERQMAAAVARRFAGFVVDDLVITRTLTLERGAGLALCEAIVAAPIEPDELLGAEVADALRSRPLLSALGKLEPVSAASIAAEFEGSIPVVFLPAAPVPGWSPLVVSSDVEARAIGRLLGRETHPGAEELARRQATAERDRLLIAHRRKPIAPPIQASPGTLEIKAGVVTGRMWIKALETIDVDVRIEQRRYAEVSESGPPIGAIVEVPITWADDDFTKLDAYRNRQVVNAVRKRASDLLWVNLEADPAALAADPRVLELAVSLLRHQLLSDDSLERLRELPAFETLQGPRASVADSELAGLARIATWGGEWLGPADGEEPDPLDDPVLQVSAEAEAALFELVDGLSKEGAIDETHAVGKLQVRRAMARGILARPSIPGIASALRRELGSLGEHGRSLGEGEIALVADNPRVLVHELGVMVGHIDVDVVPPVRVAVEDPSLVPMIGRQIRSGVLAARVQRAAKSYVAALLADGVELPWWAARAIGGAVLAGAIDPALCGDRPLFETTAGERRSWTELVDQAAQLGDVWYVCEQTSERPLDPQRFVVRLDPGPALQRDAPFLLTEASGELELDARARANRDRPPVDGLEISPEVVMAALEIASLEGDGINAPRGKVAVLVNDRHRGVDVFRELKSLGRIDDPCEWPTYAVVDDRRLTPDRTWSAPEGDEILGEVTRAIRKASERALATLTPAPRDVLATRPVWSFDTARSRAAVRGRIWLSGRWDTGTIAVECSAGEILVHPTAVDGTPLPVSGKLLVYSAGHFDAGEVEILARARYAELVRAALALERAPHLMRAHAAVGLATGLLTTEMLGDMTFECFAPEPLDVHGLATLFELESELPVVTKAGGEELAIVDDGSLASHLLISMLGADRAEEPAVEPEPEPEGAAENPPVFDEPSHPLNGLAQVLASRLDNSGVRGYFLNRVSVMASMRSLLSYRSGTLYLGGASDELAAIEVARQASSPWAEAAIDALVAHAVAELTEELVEVGAHDQMKVLESLLV